MTTEAAKMSALTWSELPGIMSGSGDDTGTEPSDETLVAAVARGEERALELLIRRHGGWAARFAERLTGNAAMADEVVQNGFLKIWQKAGTWEGRSRFSTWLYRVPHNLAVDPLRAQRNAGRSARRVLGCQSVPGRYRGWPLRRREDASLDTMLTLPVEERRPVLNEMRRQPPRGMSPPAGGPGHRDGLGTPASGANADDAPQGPPPVEDDEPPVE
jgi:RNA polymerase sigma factor (sigma-70 family)